MSKTYFIWQSGNEIEPYDNLPKASQTFNTLLTNVNLLFGDEIRVHFGDIIDDSTNTIYITSNVKIRNNTITLPKVKLISELGFNITGDGVEIEGIEFFSDESTDNEPLVKIEDVSNVKIKNCKFSTVGGGDPSSLIQIVNSKFVTIEDCEFIQRTSDMDHACINIQDSSKVDIKGNKIRLDGSKNLGVFVNGEGSDVNIYGNLIIPNISDDIIGGIRLDGEYDNVNIYRNVIRYSNSSPSTKDAFGISLDLTDSIGIKIKNNTIICDYNVADSYGIKVDINGDNKIEITNNIIFRNSVATSGVATDIPNDDDIIFDYNWIYNWDEEYGQRYTVTDVNPLIKIIENPLLDIPIYDNYKVQEESRCFGTGIYYENVGIDENNLRTYSTVVDTFFDATVDPSISEINFIGTVFSTGVEEVNELYGKSYTEEDDYYGNQFNWSAADIVDDEDFPFWKGNDFYNQDIYYVIKNRKELEPFENIWCPANPGYGFPEYKDYETGLFGYKRISYINNCGECIIQDDIETNVIWEDDIDNGIIIEDDINPPCTGE